MKIENEPTLDTIDDYNNNETPEKRRNIRLIIVGLLIFASINAYFRFTYNTVSDYIGTPENPGITLPVR